LRQSAKRKSAPVVLTPAEIRTLLAVSINVVGGRVVEGQILGETIVARPIC